MSKPLQRPSQVTSACLFVGLSCALLLINLIQILTTWNSLSVQEGLRAIFDAAGTPLTDAWSESIRILLQVLVVLLIAGLVCAVYAMRRHAASRIVLTVVATLTALTFMAIGGVIGLIPAAFAVYAVVQLWSAPARRWFAGQAEPATAARTPDPAPTRPDPFAQRPVETPGQPQVATAPHAPPALGRPAAVGTIVLVVTIGSAIALVGSLVMVAAFTTLRDEMVTEYETSSFTRSLDLTTDEWHTLLRVLAVGFGVFAVLSIAAIVAAMALARGSRGAGATLLVLAVLTIGAGVLTLPLGLVWAGLAVWVITLLRRPDVRYWLDGARR